MKCCHLVLFVVLIFVISETQVNCMTNKENLNIKSSSSNKIIDKELLNKFIDEGKKVDSKNNLKKTVEKIVTASNSEMANVLKSVGLSSNKNITSPSVQIDSIETNILIKRGKTSGTVIERVRYTLSNGIFDSVVKKISLSGTSEKLYSFKLASMYKYQN